MMSNSIARSFLSSAAVDTVVMVVGTRPFAHPSVKGAAHERPAAGLHEIT